MDKTYMDSSVMLYYDRRKTFCRRLELWRESVNGTFQLWFPG